MEAFQNDSRVPQTCPNPVFVIGSHRSGTTVLARALNRHPDFWASDETLFMPALFGGGRVEGEIERWTSRPRGSWLRRQNVSREEFLSYLGMGLNALFTNRSEGKRWIDHTPHHALMAEALAAMFPGAYFLHILRDGRRVVHSMIHLSSKLSEDERENKRAWRGGGSGPAWKTDFKKACEHWRKMSAAALDFCEKHPERSLTIRVEELERDPSDSFAGVLKFLQAAPSDGPARYFASHRINSSFSESVTLGNQAVDKISEPWETWTPKQKEIFTKEAGEALASYGFSRNEEETDRFASQRQGELQATA
jgi:hypothetical protein